jgi:2,3-bisphosphoglycerate-independent phosphoglycerate mutase
MKTVMVIIDGVGDEPIAELGGRTPLEAAFIPNMHYMASRGRIGRIRTTFPGFPIESMVCIMGLLGYEPDQFYPCGRASFEAMAKGIPLHPDDLVLRCNTVTVDKNRQTLSDFTAAQISDSDARALVAQIALPHHNWELFPGQSYRNLLIIRNAGVNAGAFKCREPHMNIGKGVHDNLPFGNDSQTTKLAADISAFLLDTQRQIAGMDLPVTCAANMLWVWSPSRKPVWPSFFERTKVRAAVVGGLDFLHGIAMAARIHFDTIPGATGYIDTNYSAKADYTLRYLDHYDFVLTHINSTDEEAHLHNHRGKIEAIEKIDRYVVGPVLQQCVQKYGDQFRIVVCGDHATQCSDGKHTDVPVPYALYCGDAVRGNNGESFSENRCARYEPMGSLSFLQDTLWGARQ